MNGEVLGSRGQESMEGLESEKTSKKEKLTNSRKSCIEELLEQNLPEEALIMAQEGGEQLSEIYDSIVHSLLTVNDIHSRKEVLKRSLEVAKLGASEEGYKELYNTAIAEGNMGIAIEAKKMGVNGILAAEQINEITEDLKAHKANE